MLFSESSHYATKQSPGSGEATRFSWQKHGIQDRVRFVWKAMEGAQYEVFITEVHEPPEKRQRNRYNWRQVPVIAWNSLKKLRSASLG